MTPGKRPGWLTWTLVALLIVFFGGDAFAELKSDGKSGTYGETVSTLIHHAEKGRWYVRGGVLVVCMDFLLHLTFGTSLLPGVF